MRGATIRAVVTLELYVLRQLCVSLLISIGGMLLIAIPGILVSAVQKLGGGSMGVVLGYLPIVIVGLLPYLAPVGFLLTVVAVYGRLAADNEWTAIAMAGIHPLRVVAPAAVMAIAIALPLRWVMTDVNPSLNFVQRSYYKSSVVRIVRTLAPGKTELRIGDFYMSARSRDSEARNRFQQVFIHVPAHADKPSQTLLATSAAFSFEGPVMLAELERPRWISGGHDLRYGKTQLRYDLDKHFNPDRSDTSWKYQTSAELSERIARTRALVAKSGEAALAEKTQAAGYIPPQDLDVATFELHARDTVAASILMFLTLGLATALMLRSGSMLAALATAVGYALAYYLLSMRMGKALALSGAVPQALAAWATTVVGTLAGLALCWKALRR